MHFKGTARDLVRPPLRRWVCLIITVFLVSASLLPGEGALQREYEIKAAYLYNFISYINWPEQALPPAGGTITIGVLGQNPFGAALAPLGGKRIKGRILAVKECASPADAADCQIVFICPSEKLRVAEILQGLKDAKVLSVSEIDGFAERGGMINFISEHNKVRFEINSEAARRTGLTISSDLLKLAHLVKS